MNQAEKIALIKRAHIKREAERREKAAEQCRENKAKAKAAIEKKGRDTLDRKINETKNLRSDAVFTANTTSSPMRSRLFTHIIASCDRVIYEAEHGTYCPKTLKSACDRIRASKDEYNKACDEGYILFDEYVSMCNVSKNAITKTGKKYPITIVRFGPVPCVKKADAEDMRDARVRASARSAIKGGRARAIKTFRKCIEGLRESASWDAVDEAIYQEALGLAGYTDHA